VPTLLETGELGRILWRWGVGVALAAVATELLPVLFGTGEDASWDWSFTYVTARFVLIPLFSVAHLVLGVVFIALWLLERPAVPWAPVASITISALYLIGLWAYPSFWFVGTR
jgi:hypothetical protein